MTRQYFIENVNTIEELIDFKNECNADIDSLSHIYDYDSMNSSVNDDMYYWAREWNWIELRDKLNDIPEYGDWFVKDDWGDWQEYDESCFEEDKQNFIDEIDEYWPEIWDEPVIEEEETEEDEIDLNNFIFDCMDEFFKLEGADEIEDEETDDPDMVCELM